MGREFKEFLIDVLRPPALTIGFVIKGLYRLLIGWWYEPRVRTLQQNHLLQEVQEQFGFLFTTHTARIVSNDDIGQLAALDCPVVTVSAEGLLLRFIEHRGTRRVHVASERLPTEWHDLSSVLNAIEPDKVRRHSIVFFQDAARLLGGDWDLVRAAFSPERYPELREQLEHAYGREMAVTLEVQDEINRKLYN